MESDNYNKGVNKLEQDGKTEEVIFDAAKEIFLERGFDGAKMQDIADHAGINKSLLHYYYRSKEKLFDIVFSQIVNQFFKKMGEIWDTEESIENKISSFIDTYVDFLIINPFVPRFIINTLARSPKNAGDLLNQKTDGMLNKFNSKIEKIQKDIDNEVEQGILKPTIARDLLINTISLLIFPFVGEPMIRMIFNMPPDEYKKYLFQRKSLIKDMLYLSIKK